MKSDSRDKFIDLGEYETEEEAAMAYDIAMILMSDSGELDPGDLNFPGIIVHTDSDLFKKVVRRIREHLRKMS